MRQGSDMPRRSYGFGNAVLESQGDGHLVAPGWLSSVHCLRVEDTLDRAVDHSKGFGRAMLVRVYEDFAECLDDVGGGTVASVAGQLGELWSLVLC